MVDIFNQEDVAPDVIQKFWQLKLNKEARAHRTWREKDADKAMKVYLDDQETLKVAYPVYWALIRILHGMVYSSTPKPEARRRAKNAQNPAYRHAGVAMERGISYFVDQHDFDGIFNQCVDDYLITGLGVPRVVYEPQMRANPEGFDEIGWQKVHIQRIPWKHFRWEPTTSWEDVSWIAFELWLTRNEFIRQFDRAPNAQAAKSTPDGSSENRERGYEERWRVFEIWSKVDRKVYVIEDGGEVPLDVWDDQLNLEGFYPCAKPMMMGVLPSRCVPKPDYKSYECHIRLINRLQGRIMALSNAVKDVGFKDASLSELDAFETAQDGDLIAVNGLMERLQTAGGSGTAFDRTIAKWPITETAAVLQQLVQIKQMAVAELWEVAGVTDAQRGAAMAASESATQSRLKEQMANTRVALMQMDVNRCIRDTFRIMAEIFAEHFQPEVIHMMTDVQTDDGIMQVLRNDALRGFAVDIETDSTIARSEAEDKEQRMGLMQTITNYMNTMVGHMQSGALSADFVKDALQIGIGGHKYARAMMDSLETLPGTQQQLQMLGNQIQEGQNQIGELTKRNQQLEAQIDHYRTMAEETKRIAALAEGDRDYAQAEKLRAEAGKVEAEETKLEAEALQVLTGGKAENQANTGPG